MTRQQEEAEKQRQHKEECARFEDLCKRDANQRAAGELGVPRQNWVIPLLPLLFAQLCITVGLALQKTLNFAL
jgi:hypothetical protein